MLRKPFKAPGSKDGQDSSSNLPAKPFVKPAVSIAIQSATKIAAVPVEMKTVSDNTQEESANKKSEISDQPKSDVIKPSSGMLGLKAKPFKPVGQAKVDVSSSSIGKPAGQVTPTCDEKVTVEEYFKCFWSKDVKKKHKVLDDGIIVFQGNKVQIYNSDGGKIYDSYKSKLYCPNPDNGDQYIVGSYFVEQDGPIKKDDFLSGRCFVKAKMTFDKEQLAYQFYLF